MQTYGKPQTPLTLEGLKDAIAALDRIAIYFCPVNLDFIISGPDVNKVLGLSEATAAFMVPESLRPELTRLGVPFREITLAQVRHNLSQPSANDLFLQLASRSVSRAFRWPDPTI